jgi:hypothetical protein
MHALFGKGHTTPRRSGLPALIMSMILFDMSCPALILSSSQVNPIVMVQPDLVARFSSPLVGMLFL